MDPCHRVRAGLGDRAACATHANPWPCQVKALSLTRPWSDLVANGLKNVENRVWGTQYRGLLVIHAAQSWDGRTAARVAQPILGLTATSHDNLLREKLHHTGYLGWCRVVDCHADGDLICDVSRGTSPCSPWAFEGQFHWQLADACRFLEPIDGGGRLGLFAPPDDVIGRIRDAMWETGCRE